MMVPIKITPTMVLPVKSRYPFTKISVMSDSFMTQAQVLQEAAQLEMVDHNSPMLLPLKKPYLVKNPPTHCNIKLIELQV
jgi:hypothetical protein